MTQEEIADTARRLETTIAEARAQLEELQARCTHPRKRKATSLGQWCCDCGKMLKFAQHN